MEVSVSFKTRELSSVIKSNLKEGQYNFPKFQPSYMSSVELRAQTSFTDL